MRIKGESKKKKNRMVDENSKNDILKRKIESFLLEEKSTKGYWMEIWRKENILNLKKKYTQCKQGISYSVGSNTLQSHEV